jgi:hypothetical protein
VHPMDFGGFDALLWIWLAFSFGRAIWQTHVKALVLFVAAGIMMSISYLFGPLPFAPALLVALLTLGLLVAGGLAEKKE